MSEKHDRLITSLVLWTVVFLVAAFLGVLRGGCLS